MKAWALVLGLFLGVLAPLEVQAEQCVPYARNASGVTLTGDAWRWWAAAEGQYERGHAPKAGAVMVFKATSQMRYGHVAVVRRIISKREIRVDHANWGGAARRGGVSLDQPVIDVSAANDWSKVRVWHAPAGTYGGRVNPLHGFIYPDDGKALPRIEQAATPPAAPARPTVVVAAVSPKSHPVAVRTMPSATPAVAANPSATATSLNAAVLARLRGVSADAILTTVKPRTPGKTSGKGVRVS